jgi:hypothetical protein
MHYPVGPGKLLLSEAWDLEYEGPSQGRILPIWLAVDRLGRSGGAFAHQELLGRRGERRALHKIRTEDQNVGRPDGTYRFL